MFKIKLAEIVIEIHHRYDFVKKQCQKYVVDDEKVDLVVSCTDEEIKKEASLYSDEDGDITAPYCESVCIYRNICLQMPNYDAFLMHAAVIDVDGKAYAFTAQSGTGKTTHLRLWYDLLKERLTVVNGDKPILRFFDGKLFAYGTPWCGKEGWSTNMRSELKALCFLERDVNNRIAPFDKGESAMKIMKQIIIPKDPIGAIKTFELVDEMLKKTDTWLLGCNISIDAARLSYETMSGEKI